MSRIQTSLEKVFLSTYNFGILIYPHFDDFSDRLPYTSLSYTKTKFLYIVLDLGVSGTIIVSNFYNASA